MDFGGLASLAGLGLAASQSVYGPQFDPKAPVPQAPKDKYPAPVGSRYHGEYEGWQYDPYYNRYFPDKDKYAGFEESTGRLPKHPSMWQQLMPLLGQGLAANLFTGLGPAIWGSSGKESASSGGGGLLSMIGHFLGLGGGSSDSPGMTAPGYPGAGYDAEGNFGGFKIPDFGGSGSEIGGDVGGDAGAALAAYLGAPEFAPVASEIGDTVGSGIGHAISSIGHHLGF